MTPSPKPPRILVPTDFSEEADRALSHALGLAKLLNATVELVHVHGLSLYAMPPATDIIGSATVAPEVLSHLEAELAKRRAELESAGVRCESRYVVGNAANEILAMAAQSGPRMIVMGTHGRTGLKHAILGSVAERVVQKAHCPVLVVPPPDR